MSQPYDPNQPHQPEGWESRTTEFQPFSAAPPSPEQPAWGPYEPQPGYGANPYSQPPFGQAPFGQPGYQQQPPGQWPTPPPPSSHRTWIWVAAAVVAVAAVVTTLVLVLGGNSGSKPAAADRSGSPSQSQSTGPTDTSGPTDTGGSTPLPTGAGGAGTTSGRTVSAPSSVAGYSQLTGLDTGSIKSMLGGEFGGGANSTVAAYSKGGASTPGFVFVAVPVATTPQLSAGLKTAGLDRVFAGFTGGVAGSIGGSSGTTSYPPGPLGGAMRCGTGSTGGMATTFCTWGDESYFALVLSLDGSSVAQTAVTTRSLRSAAEH